MRRLLALAALFCLFAGAAPSTMRVTATAYCQSGTTKSGAPARVGILAADPAVLPVGSVLRIISGAFAGVYTVLDTGAAVEGRADRHFLPRCGRPQPFGRKTL